MDDRGRALDNGFGKSLWRAVKYENRTGYRGMIAFGSSDSTASLPTSYTYTAADQGVHTFTGLVLKKKGKQTITVTDTLDSSLTASVLIHAR